MTTNKVTRPSLAEIGAMFPEALEMFDWQCPRLAGAPDCELRVCWKGQRHNKVTTWTRASLVAAAPATFDEVPSPVQSPGLQHAWFIEPRTYRYETAGGYTCTPTRELRAYWEPAMRVWRRLTWTQPAPRMYATAGGITRFAPGAVAYTDGV